MTRREAYITAICKLVEAGPDVLLGTKKHFKHIMRGVTDYCAGDAYVYKNAQRCSQVYRYSVKAWPLRTSKKCKGLVGEHVVPAEVVFGELVRVANTPGGGQEKSVRKLLECLEVVMITKAEAADLNKKKEGKSQMPAGWSPGKDRLARLSKHEIKIAPESEKNNLRISTV